MNRTLKIINREGSVLIAIGNDGRQDDGLGWAFAQQLEGGAFRGDIHFRYQLQVEDAALIAAADSVLFVDASKERIPEGFSLSFCQPENHFSFTTHSLAPAAVLAISRELFGSAPPAFILAIEGAEWELQRGLSLTGKEHLDKALQWFKDALIKDVKLPSS